ncbi:MAG: hypothetical protein ACYC61_09410 [Isosphaeraceae bacterium]
MSDQSRDDLIAGYIRGYTQPMQWVGWCLDAAGTPAEQDLAAVLHEPGGEVLRDLTAPEVREAVIRAVLASEVLRLTVESELERFLESLADRLGQEMSEGQ